MSRGKHIPFELKDFFLEDPFRTIVSKRKGDTYFYNAYVDYNQDLETLRIAWTRLKQGCKEISEIDAQLRSIQTNDLRFDDEATSLFFREHGLMNILQSDVRAFIDIARTIMNKIAKLIEKILGLSPGKGHRVSFTDHKKRLPVKHPDIHPVYLNYLTNRTYWYEQELLLLRDNIFVHGNTFITPWQVSLDDGIKIIKRSEFGGLEEKNKTVYQSIKNNYETRHNFRVTENDYISLDQFLREIRRRGIKLDDRDFDKIRNIVSSFGITIDEEFLESIAQHLEDFMNDVSAVFKDYI